jgi:hypothetical protein
MRVTSMGKPRNEPFYQWDPFPYLGYWLLEPVHGSEAHELDIVLNKGTRLSQASLLDYHVDVPGAPMDLGITAMGIPIVSPRAAVLLLHAAADDVQLIPCRIDGVDRGFQVVNIVTRLDCVDRVRSKLITIGGPAGTSLDGIPSWIIDPARAAGHALFRLDNEHRTIVVSEALKEEIVRQRMVGPGLIELDGEGLRNLMPGYKPKPAKGRTRPKG